MLLTGRRADGEEGMRLGLVDRLAADGGADAVAAELAATFAAGPSEALAAIVRCVDAAGDLSFAEGMAVEREEVLHLFGTADARERIRAFLEKRPAEFT